MLRHLLVGNGHGGRPTRTVGRAAARILHASGRRETGVGGGGAAAPGTPSLAAVRTLRKRRCPRFQCRGRCPAGHLPRVPAWRAIEIPRASEGGKAMKVK